MAQLNSNLCFGALFNSFSCNVIASSLLSYTTQEEQKNSDSSPHVQLFCFY